MLKRSIFILIFFTCLPVLAADFDDEGVFRSPQFGVYIMLPERWTATNQTGYPSLLAYMFPEGNNDVSVSLAVGNLLPQDDLSQVAKRNLTVLRNLGYQVSEEKSIILTKRSVWQAVLTTKNDSPKTMQLYLVHNSQYFVLTYYAPVNQFNSYQADVFQILDSLMANLPAAQEHAN